jgi:outer membrane receptor protein involved in Fe transport
MNKLYLLFAFFVCFSITLSAQQRPPDVLKVGIVSGQIIDSQSNEPLEYATIAIFRERDSTLVTGTITAQTGNFRITEIPVGKYYAKIDFLGYKTLIKGGLNITMENPEVRLRKITLEPLASTLEGVNIVADKPMYQNQIDRKVINPDKDIMSAGGTALNVLESAPSVDVDVEGNVALRGSTSVTILIDGRPSGYSGESAGDLLQQIPAGSIDRIEVITNPSSKYNPEGITGIINIVMKKNTYGGYNGSINAGIGTMLDYGAGGNFNYRNDVVNIYTNVGLNNRKMESTGKDYRESYYNGDTTIYNQPKNDYKSSGTGLSARAGIDFFINKKNTFTLTGNLSGNPQPRTGVQLTDHEIIGNNPQNYRTENEDKNKRFSYNAGALWEKTFSNKNHFLLFDASFGKRENNGTALYDRFDRYDWDTINEYPADKRKTITESFTQDFEGKVDYALPMKHGGKFETGGAVRLRTMGSGMNRITNMISSKTDTTIYDFTYNEDVYALYAQYGAKIGKFSFQAGLRGEYTDIQSDLKEPDKENEKTPQSYFQPYPTAYIMYEIKEKNELKLNYTRRINRPGPWNLNPFQDFSDPMSIRKGNPELKPEYINSLELDYFRYLKSGTMSATLFYRNTTNVISRTTYVDANGASISTWDNLNSNNAYGLELVFNTKFFNMWQFNSGANFGYSKISGELDNRPVNRGSLSWSLRANNSFQVTETTALQFNARYVGPRLPAQGEFKGHFAGDVGFRQDFLKKTLSLTLQVRDVFNTMKFSSESKSENFYSEFTRKPKGCTGYLTLTWKFGNMNMRDTKKRQPSGQQSDSDDGMDMY